MFKNVLGIDLQQLTREVVYADIIPILFILILLSKKIVFDRPLA